MKADLDLGPLADPVDPVALRAMQERRELLRIASVRSLDLDRQIAHLDPNQRRTAQRFARVKPLQAPLGNGAPGGAL
jgi:hypothetical protein